MLDSIKDDHLVGRETPTGDCVGNLVSMMVHCAHHLSFLIPHMQTKIALAQHVFHGLLMMQEHRQLIKRANTSSGYQLDNQTQIFEMLWDCSASL
jgi:hypothetical protein